MIVVAGQKRPTEAGYLFALERWRAQGALRAGDLILSDNESCFKTAEVRALLDSWAVAYDFFPARRGALMNPCDNLGWAT